jgi:S-adenosylmethionine decarboxylase
VLTSPFEGPEKKLEIILFAPHPGLRAGDNGRWDRVVAAGRAQILSRISTNRMDAYLLSESSLFVWEDRILMITCGKTTLARAVLEIVDIVGPESVAFLFYEQKNFMFPKDQPSSFEEDVALITGLFPGKYYKLGPANDDHVNVFYSSHTREKPEQDATFQVLMHTLDPRAMGIFCKEKSPTPSDADRQSGLDVLYNRKMLMDGYLFSPCGYSVNSIREEEYFTVHVTPQPFSSYVSFESNILENDYSHTLGRIVGIFKPGRFSAVLTTSMDDACSASHDTLSGPLAGYRITDKTQYEFDCGYKVTFINYRLTGEGRS